MTRGRASSSKLAPSHVTSSDRSRLESRPGDTRGRLDALRSDVLTTKAAIRSALDNSRHDTAFRARTLTVPSRAMQTTC
jgi:hypothetical protein